jgi:hypothetical protein
MTELKEHVMPDIAIDDATPTCRVVGAGAEARISTPTASTRRPANTST